MENDGQGSLRFTETRADQVFRRFSEFHRNNPMVWDLFCQFADEARTRHSRYSADAILHRVRWEVSMTVQTHDHVKINNDFGPYYARMYLALFDQAAGFFELRRRKSAERDAYNVDIPAWVLGPPGDESELYARLRALGRDAS